MDFGKILLKNFVKESGSINCVYFTLQIYSHKAPLLQGMCTIAIDDFLYIVGGVDNDDNNQSTVTRIILDTDKDIMAPLHEESMAAMNYSRSFFALFELPCYN